MGWINALRRARKELGLEDTYVTINRGPDGIALYKRACEIHGNKTKNCQAATGMSGPPPPAVPPTEEDIDALPQTKEEKREEKREEKKERKVVKKIKKTIEKGSDLIQKTSKKMAKSLLDQVKESMAIPEVQKGVLVTALGALAVAGARSDKGQQAIQTLTQKLPDLSGVPAHIKENIQVFLDFIRNSKGKLQDLATNVASTIAGGIPSLPSRGDVRRMVGDRATGYLRDRGTGYLRDTAERVAPGLFQRAERFANTGEAVRGGAGVREAVRGGAGSIAQATLENLQARYTEKAARSGTGETP